MCKHRVMEGKIRDKAVKGMCVIGSLARIMRGRNISIEVKRGLGKSILLSTLTYGLERRTWNRAQQSRVCAVVMSNLKRGCGITKRNVITYGYLYM